MTIASTREARMGLHDYKGMRSLLLVITAACAVVFLHMPATLAQAPAAAAKPKPDVVYVPTPQPVVDAMLALANVKKTDVVYDLGSGDGRIVITAAQKYGARGVGIELDAGYFAMARAVIPALARLTPKPGAPPAS